MARVPAGRAAILLLAPRSIVRHIRAISGAMRRNTASVRQSNDCTLTRAANPASLIALHHRGGKGLRIGHVGAGVGVILVSMLNRT